MAKSLILCDCMGSQSIDSDGLSDAAGLACSKVHTGLCTTQVDAAAAAIAGGEVVIACQQERALFETLAAEIEAPEPAFLDLRDRAGWSDDPAPKLPKMAALTAEAMLDVPTAKTLDVVSEGMCLIMGPADVALKAAADLAETLSVTVLITEGELPEFERGFDIILGRLKQASGSFGAFELRLDQLQQPIPGGRGPLAFTEPKDGARTQCDLILDLTGGTALFPAPDKRDGYLRADPGSIGAVASAVLAASQMVGTFEKPLYVRLEEPLCAHSRAEKPACSNCLGVCPTGAITSAGEHVAIDPMICAGCGSCAAVCPSGAISYDAPPVDTLFRRIQTLASAFRKAGGANPRLLIHDDSHGREMIALAARFSRGLPADVIPLEVDALSGIGHAEMLAALASGFAQVDLLLSPKTERDALDPQLALAEALGGAGKLRLLEPQEPDALCDLLYDQPDAQAIPEPILPMGTRRQVARLSAKTLNPNAETLTLPANAPYGAVVVDQDSCTLCLSCVSLCPSGALGDNPDMPQLRFQEDACLQCGLCTNICPEDAITLKPQMDLTDAAFTQKVVHEEAPAECVECGALFGVQSTIDRIMEKLAGKHSMFATSDAARMIQMCDTCRINAQFHSENNPFAQGERPKVRTTDDYLSKRRDH
ncbi:4Fe-4S dicluster protein [Litoreibacter ponti]|uniref:4Fe-4S dicluster protein n=1 Tax=Litoreibacter ponti TaxID=1510457 RepID=A0A2T6BEW8_9RHOB|nr:4Fe-4S binding protein [Litoreibacter ponti]PTX54600.1 4Fe-4S dicluster protein [Litoreibacter ponti]